MLGKKYFIDLCTAKRCPRNSITSRKCETDAKRERCFKKYVALEEKHIEKRENDIDEQWEQIRKEVAERDQSCRLLKILSIEEMRLAEKILTTCRGTLYETLDCAHVFGKGAHPKIKYDSKNVVYMHRVFHGRLDQYKNPVTGKSMTKEEHQRWWKRIIDDETWNYLLEVKNG